QSLRLKRNTAVVFPYVTRGNASSLLADRRFDTSVTVQATGNLWSYPGGAWDGLPVFRVLMTGKHVRWQGHANCFAGLTVGPAPPEGFGLAAWRKLVDREEESGETAPAVFAWQLLQLPTSDLPAALADVLLR